MLFPLESPSDEMSQAAPSEKMSAPSELMWESRERVYPGQGSEPKEKEARPKAIAPSEEVSVSLEETAAEWRRR